jgi:ABC-2 type transport system permease protein
MTLLADSATMTGRALRLSRRNTDALVTAVMLPVVLMLLFVYVFGGAIHTGTSYVTYVVPGIILICVGFGAATTAVVVSTDMTSGVIDRFRSLPIAAPAVLAGHVVASVARNTFAALVVLAVALAIGFRPSASALEWVAAAGVLLLFVVAMSWVCALMGLLAGSPEAASGYTFLILFLPYVSSAFVPTDSMPTWLQAVARDQPMTPVIETLRGLLTGRPIGNNATLAVIEFAAIGIVFAVLATVVFRRRTAD